MSVSEHFLDGSKWFKFYWAFCEPGFFDKPLPYLTALFFQDLINRERVAKYSFDKKGRRWVWMSEDFLSDHWSPKQQKYHLARLGKLVLIKRQGKRASRHVHIRYEKLDEAARQSVQKGTDSPGQSVQNCTRQSVPKGTDSYKEQEQWNKNNLSGLRPDGENGFHSEDHPNGFLNLGKKETPFQLARKIASETIESLGRINKLTRRANLRSDSLAVSKLISGMVDAGMKSGEAAFRIKEVFADHVSNLGDPYQPRKLAVRTMCEHFEQLEAARERRLHPPGGGSWEVRSEVVWDENEDGTATSRTIRKRVWVPKVS